MAPRSGVPAQAGRAVVNSFVGNPGCIRFPAEVRKASGIKRGDRLLVVPTGPGCVVLEKSEIPDARSVDVEVEGCACSNPPEGCTKVGAELVTVGWSYVQLNPGFAEQLGFLADRPVQLIGEPAQITVSIRNESGEEKEHTRVECPPGSGRRD